MLAMSVTDRTLQKQELAGHGETDSAMTQPYSVSVLVILRQPRFERTASELFNDFL
jgi:hypothetical protein